MTPSDVTTGDGVPTPPDADTAWFLVVAGEGTLASYALCPPSVVIGRADDCDVVIDHRAFSRRHLRLTVHPTRTVQDLGSKNGVVVDGRVVRGGGPISIEGTRGFHVGPHSLMLVPGPAERAASSERSGHEPLVVEDPTPTGVSTVVRELAKSPLSVLILGETGAGKEVLAETIHRASGRSGPLCRINCAALSEALLESELFGHEKGAFTGATSARVGLLEASDGGTVFLDEVGELSERTQAKLLRAVEAKEIIRVGSTRALRFDARFVAATHRELSEAVRGGRFRADLYFRLAGVTLRIPPLRERRAAVGALALRFLDDAAARAGRAPATLSLEALAALQTYAFPGNVRELKSVVERAEVLARGGTILSKHLGLVPSPVAPSSPAAPIVAGPDDERDAIVRALEQHAGNQTRAAETLGISRTTLVQRLRLFGIRRPRG